MLRGGALQGAAGAAVVAGGVALAGAAGVSAPIITGGLIVIAAAGAIATGMDLAGDPSAENIAAAAGGLVGGALVGGALGTPMARRIDPNASGWIGWSPKRDWANRYRPSMGPIKKWLGTGPDGPGTTASMLAGGTGAGVLDARVVRTQHQFFLCQLHWTRCCRSKAHKGHFLVPFYVHDCVGRNARYVHDRGGCLVWLV